MIQKQGNRKLYAIVAGIVVLLLIVGGIVFATSQQSSPASDATTTKTQDEPVVTEEAESTETTVPQDTTSEAVIDPEQVSTVAIEPMTITVSYMKGIEGFDYEVLRNPNGTQYVQFSSTKLVGTKCTNDKGVFASIIEKPTENESATITEKTTVSGAVYGLSLTDSSCTPDEPLLKQYQDAFTTPFTLLKKM